MSEFKFPTAEETYNETKELIRLHSFYIKDNINESLKKLHKIITETKVEEKYSTITSLESITDINKEDIQDLAIALKLKLESLGYKVEYETHKNVKMIIVDWAKGD